MAKGVIEVHYHPAIKTVIFKTADGKSFEPDQLKQWQRDKFILQEHGEDFFDSIAEAFAGAEKIEINFFGTQIDYEDFCEMVEYYNKSKGNDRFTHKQSGVLLGMDEMYREAEKFGDKAVEKLKRKLVKIDIAGGSNSIKDDFKAELGTYIEQIDSKIRNLQSTGINICFVGTYSAGKSSLINAILGEKILPEEDESKTAKFYLIDQPVVNERERIRFDIDDDSTIVEWNGTSLELTDKGGQSGSHPLRETIMDCIKKNSGEVKHKQFYALLDLLNGEDCVGVKISVKYPIPINTPSMSFTIYDTPGTGSNTLKHKDVLEEAVKEQSHSIVVFVGGVTKLEGEGNSLLLQILNGDSHNSIDLDRSLYVINRSDTTDVEELHKYQTEMIKLRDSADVEKAENKTNVAIKMEIPLKDKKLFFVSATQAYAAKAKQHDKTNPSEPIFASPKEDRVFKKILAEEVFFEYNKYGNSEAATKRVKTSAREALKSSDEYDKVYINAGLFSLVEAIKEYGTKYAMATKVNALVSTVEDIFDKLRKAAQNQEAICNTEIDKLQKDLDTITGSITNAINNEYNKNIPKKNENENRWVLEENEKKDVGIDVRSIKNIADDIRIRVEEELQQMQNDSAVKKAKWWDDKLSVFDAKFADKAAERKLKKEVINKYIDNRKIASVLKTGLSKYIENFNTKQKTTISGKQAKFKEAVKKVIEQSGDLTQAAKDYLIQGLGKKPFDDAAVNNYDADVGDIVRDCIDVKGKWIFAKEVVDITKLLTAIKKLISEELGERTQEFIESFCDNLNKVIDDVRTTFENNAEEYSVRVQDIKKSQGQVKEIAAETENAARELDSLIKALMSLIREGTANE